MRKLFYSLYTPDQHLQPNPTQEFNLETTLITDKDGLSLLRDEWKALYNKADKPYFTQSFEWNWCCWQTVSESRKDRLHCVVIRCDGRILLIWPLVIRRKDYFWTVAHPLSWVSTEYSEVLVDPAEDGMTLIKLALQGLMAACPCDFIAFPITRADSLLHQVVDEKYRLASTVTRAPYISAEKYPDWDSYYRQLNAKNRQNLGRQIRRLSELGEDLRFEILDQDIACQTELNWLIQTKLEWVTAKNLAWSPFTSSYIKFLASMINNQGEENARMAICVLKLGDKTIAGYIIRVDKARVEIVIGSYDPEFFSYSPVKILAKHIIQWGLERKLTIDYRLGDGDHKREWTTESCEVVNFEVYRHLWGKLHGVAKSTLSKTRDTVTEYQRWLSIKLSSSSKSA